MKLTTTLTALLIPFLFFAQEGDVFKQLSLELGFKTSFMSSSSEEVSDGCSGHCYYYYQADESKVLGKQGHIQLSYTRNRVMIPLSLGYLRWDQELQGSDRGGYNLTINPQYYGSTFTYKSYSEYVTASSGIGLNVLQNSDKVFLGPILRANYAFLLKKVVTTDECSYDNGWGASHYLTIRNPSKHSIRPSIGALFRFNTEMGLQFSLEAGYNRSIENSPTLRSINNIKGGVYTQFTLGFNFNKISLPSEKQAK